MKGIVIFVGGALTGAAVTLGALSIIYKRRQKENPDDIFEEEDDWKEVQVDMETIQPEPEGELMNKEDINIQEAEKQNEIMKEYVAQHREPDTIILEPWIMSDEDWKLSPYEKAYYTYFAQDDLLVDEHGDVITDDRCGDMYVDIVETEGICHICNEDLETNFEITLNDDESYHELVNEHEDLFFDE